MPLVHFSDYFRVDPADVSSYGAFNISLIQDLPLFIDPFLLFNSDKPAYQELHDEIVEYVRFLRDKADATGLRKGLLAAWFRFPEVKQTWLGYSESGNEGRGLGPAFARSLNKNLATVFTDFGAEGVARSSHLEKLTLIEEGVGKDNISDFTTNLIKRYLCEYTEEFARAHVAPTLRKQVNVSKVVFNYDTESWGAGRFDLPWDGEDYVLLTPRDMLTKDETWINKSDMYTDFADVASAVGNDQLRAQVNNYFLSKLPKDAKRKDEIKAIRKTYREFPQLIEYFIRLKEDRGDLAESISKQHVQFIETIFVSRLKEFLSKLSAQTAFYGVDGGTLEEARQRVLYLKDIIENKGGHKIFFAQGERIRREKDLHILFRLTWFATPSDVSTEVDDGRGPADFKISRGSLDKSIVEFKLASNTHLKNNLKEQVETYKKASSARGGLKVIVYFSGKEYDRVRRILRQLGMTKDPNIILIDADPAKPSGSRAA